MRRRWSIPLAALGILLSIVLLVVVAGVAWLASPGGRDVILRMATDAAREFGLSIALNGVGGSLLGELTIARVDVDDTDGRWLEGSDVKLVWHPWHLLRGRVHVGEISAQTLHMTRSPHLPPAEDTGEPGGIPSLPLPIEIDRVAVARLDVGEDVFGRAIAASIDSHAMAGHDEGKIGLHLHRLDAPGDLNLEAVFDVPRDALAIDLHVDEPPGGLVAGLIGLEGEPAVRVDVAGEGPLSQWRGQLRATINDAEWATVNATVDGRVTRTITIDGHIGTQPFAARMPEELASSLGSEIGIASRIVIDAKQLRVEGLEIETDAVDLAMSGSYGRDTGELGGEARLMRLAPELAQRYGVVIDAPDLSLDARSNRGRTEVTLRMAAGRIEAQGAAINGLQATVEAVRPDNSSPWTMTLTTNGEVAALPGEQTPATAKLLGPLALSAHGTFEPSLVSLDDLRFTVGPATLAAAGQYREQQADGTLSLDVSDLVGLVPGFTSESPVGARFATAVHYGANEGLALNDLTLDLPGGQITGEVGLDAAFEQINATFKSAGFDLSAVSGLIGTPLAGRLSVTSSVTGALTDPTVSANASLQDGSFEGRALPPAELQANVATAVTAPQGDLALVVHPPQGTTTLSTRFALANNNQLDLRAIRIDGPGVRADGDIGLALDRGLASGQIKLDATNLAPLLSSAGLGGSGSAKLRLSLSAANNVQQADLTGDVTSVVVSRDRTELARVGRATLTAKGALAPKSPITARLRADTIAASGTPIRQLNLDVRGTADLMNFDLTVAAPAYRDLQVVVAGSLRTEGDVRTIRLTRGSGSVMGKPFTVQSGMTAIIAPNSYQVRGLQISGRDLGQATADVALKAGTLDGRLAVNGVPLTLMNSADAGSGVLGQIDLTATLAGTIERPNGRLALSARGVGLSGDRAGNKADVTVDVSIDDRAAVLQVRVTGLSETPLAANAQIVRSPKGLGFDDNSALSGRFAWRGAIGELTKFAPLVGQEVSGNIVTDLTLTGTLGRPGITGTAVMNDAVVEDYLTGLVLRIPLLEIAGDSRGIVLQAFEASDPSGGKIFGHARLDLDRLAGFPFSAQLNFSQARVLNRDDVMTILSGTLTAEGNINKATLRGDLQSDRTEINLDTGLPPSVVTIDVKEIPPPQGQGGTQRAGAAADSEIFLDIKLALPGRVFVRGRGLDSEWEGNLAVTGNAAKPQVSGKLTSRRGQFNIIERVFKLQPSEIDLAPSADGSVDALLNIKAVYETSDLQVTISVTGTPAKPTIELSSVPSMPQDEILSRVLFNKTRASLSPIEALQLANGLRTLTSGGGGMDPLARLRRAVGIDVLRVDTSEPDRGASLEAGKYITDKVYVGIKQGAAPGTTGVAVDVDVFKNMSVGTEVRQDGSSRLGLKYKWDY